MLTRPMRDRSGVTLLEVIVSIAIMSVVAAAVVPSLGSGADKLRVQAAAASLDGLSKAILQFKERKVGKYPSELDMLATIPASTDYNSCYGSGKPSNTFGGNLESQWFGPYIERFVNTSGLPLSIGTADNLLVRVPVDNSGGQSGTLQIVVRTVTQQDVYALNDLVDGDGTGSVGMNGGTVRWVDTPATPGYVTLYYSLPISGC